MTAQQAWHEGRVRALLHDYATMALTCPERISTARQLVRESLAANLYRLRGRA